MILKPYVILVALLGGAYSLFLNVVSFLSAKNPTPKNLRDVYDEETYEKWKKYTAEHGKLKIVSSVVSTVITLLLLMTNAHAAFASLFPYTWNWQIFAVILLECVVSTIVGVIVGYIATMKIEGKYGFNRSSLLTFAFDKVFLFVGELLLSYGLAGIIGFLYEDFGVWMIPVFAIICCVLYFWGAVTYPMTARLKNKFTTLEDGELKDALKSLLDKYGYKVKAVKIMDASRRTTKLNAYFTGFGKMKTIVLYDNLIKTLSTEEICAVFAHELGHGLHKDGLKAQALNAINYLLIGAMAYVAVSELTFYSDFGFIYDVTAEGVILVTLNYGFAFVLLGIGLSVLRPIIGFVMNARSRKAEYRADRQAVIEGYGDALISAFKKMARENFSNLSPSFINVILEYSHPPLDRRIKNVERCMRRLERRGK